MQNNRGAIFEGNSNPLWRSSKTILKREKWEHLSFAEKQYVFNCNKIRGEALSDIWKRTGLSISTAKYIIRQFEINSDSASIIKTIRCKKLIKSAAVRNLIRSYVSTQNKCFTAIDIQLHLKMKIGYIIPLQQIRKNLKEEHGLSYK